jgi:DNA invertase Pin-like site-specific DNA recombinase
MFQMLGVFAEFERSMIVARVRQGIERARASGTRSGRAIGRPEIKDERVDRVLASLAAGNGILKTAKLCGVGVSVVQRLRATA